MKPEEIEQLRPGDIISRYHSSGELQEAVVEEVTETHVIARIGQQKAWLVRNRGLADFRRVRPTPPEAAPAESHS